MGRLFRFHGVGGGKRDEHVELDTESPYLVVEDVERSMSREDGRRAGVYWAFVNTDGALVLQEAKPADQGQVDIVARSVELKRKENDETSFGGVG